jgi:predicted nucleic acid-binding protein
MNFGNIPSGESVFLGLLSGDALVVAVMQSQNLIHLASNDADFDRVPGIKRYAPT